MTASTAGITSTVDATVRQVAPKDSPAANADRFLTMLVAQMRNQDPLNPLDNAQVTTQMAQISTVEGVHKLNSTLQSLAMAMGVQQNMQATSMVGRNVLTDGSTLTLDGGLARGGYALEGKATGLTLTVKAASGAVVHRSELGAQEAGMHVFEWDGKADNGQPAAPGAYTFEIAARDGKAPVAATHLMFGRVNGVTPGSNGEGPKLDLGRLGTSTLAGIKHIF